MVTYLASIKFDSSLFDRIKIALVSNGVDTKIWMVGSLVLADFLFRLQNVGHTISCPSHFIIKKKRVHTSFLFWIDIELKFNNTHVFFKFKFE